jgi:hypothetical protein
VIIIVYDLEKNKRKIFKTSFLLFDWSFYIIFYNYFNLVIFYDLRILYSILDFINCLRERNIFII